MPRVAIKPCRRARLLALNLSVSGQPYSAHNSYAGRRFLPLRGSWPPLYAVVVELRRRHAEARRHVLQPVAVIDEPLRTLDLSLAQLLRLSRHRRSTFQFPDIRPLSLVKTA